LLPSAIAVANMDIALYQARVAVRSASMTGGQHRKMLLAKSAEGMSSC
jgi:hypothetical protein